MSNPVSTYDFTLPESACETSHQLANWLGEIAKKWCFQLEQGEETGYRHYQGRLSLKVKSRLTTLKNKADSAGFNKIHLSPTSTQNAGNDFYVTKDETRIEGPWRDSDVPVYVPRQVREVVAMGWYPWQQAIINDLKRWDTRTINVILEPEGNLGKSTLVTYLGCTQQANQIAFANDYKEILRSVHDRPKRGAYLIDMPRAINKEKLFQFFAAIETVKSGYAYDDRYEFKESYFDCPNIYVFTNRMPDFNLLSRDRWRVYTINKDSKTIHPYVFPMPAATEFTIETPTGVESHPV